MTDKTMKYWILPSENNAVVRETSEGVFEQYDFFSNQWITCESPTVPRLEVTSEDVEDDTPCIYACGEGMFIVDRPIRQGRITSCIRFGYLS